MDRLPKWVLPPTMPSIYDSESYTTLEMTAKVYGAMQTLIDEYNKFADSVNKTLGTFTEEEKTARETFETEVTKVYRQFMCQMQDYLVLNLAETVQKLLDEGLKNGNYNFTTDPTLSRENVPADAKATGEQATALLVAIEQQAAALSEEIATERARINGLAKLQDGSTTGDAELADIRVDFKGNTHQTAGEAVRSQARESVSFKGYITTGTDFNAVTEPGNYIVTNEAAASCLNYPDTIGGMLTVLCDTARGTATQLLVTRDGRLRTRYKITSGWGEWSKYGLEQKTELHTDCVGPLVEIAETYFNVAYDPLDVLRYEHACGLFGEQVTDTDGKKAIVCSQFTQACIGGIEYKNSRYVGERNDRRNWGFVSDGSGDYDFTNWNPYNDYMTAGNQAKYFDGLGQLKTFDVNRNALKPGDLVFYTDPESATYKNINHVAICLGADSVRHMIMHSWPKTRYDGADLGVIVENKTYAAFMPAYYARSPIIAEYETELIEQVTFNSAGEYTERSQNITTFSINLNRGFYTVLFDDAGDSTNGYVKVYYEDGSEKNYVGVKNGGVYSVVFYAEMPVIKLNARVSDGTTYSSTRVELHKGYCPRMSV